MIAHPEDGVLALEAKGGAVRYDAGSGRWLQSGHSGVHRLGKDPFEQAEGEIRSLVRIIELQRGYGRWKPSFGHGLALPDAIYERGAHEGAPVEIVIYRDDMDRLAERVREVMTFWRRPGGTFGTEGMDALALALGYRVEIRTPLKIDFDEEDRKIVELTGEQAWILSYVLHRRRAAVTGPAGCGKTLLAIDVATHLAEGGARTLVTCVHERLADHLRESTAGIAGLTVATLTELCTQMATEAGLTVPHADPQDGEVLDPALPELLGAAARKLGPRFDAIVVDEAHEVRPPWWPALLAAHQDPEDGTLYVFADDRADRQRGGALPVEPEAVCPPLPANLRTTRQIHEFVSVTFDAEQRPHGAEPPGRPVEVLDYRDADELARLLEVVLTNLTESEHLRLDDIVVLTPEGRDKSHVWARRTFGRFRLSDRVAPDTVLWSDLDGFQGLERPVVILAELEGRNGSDVATDVYLGGSRARDHLIVLATEETARRLRASSRAGRLPGEGGT